MKKILTVSALTIFCGLGVVLKSDAQWSVTGNAATDTAVNYIGTSDNKGLKIKTNATDRVWIGTNGRVGIGTNAPVNNLDVVSNAAVTSGIRSATAGATMSMDRGLATANAAFAYKSLGTVLWNSGLLGNDNFSIRNVTTGTNLMVFTPTNNVGIGTGSPTNKLSVNGNVDFSGNVGIGTNSPTAKLEVAGQIKITGGSPGLGKVLRSDASGMASWSDFNTLGGWSVNGNSGVNSATQFIGTTDSADFIVRTNGSESMKVFPNLPMNNGAPVLPVDVLRISRDGTNNNKWNGAASFQLGSFGSDVYANTQLDIALNDEGSPSYPYVKVMSLLSNGNVGIGNTSPSAKLDVNGIGKFGDYLKIGTDVAEGYFQNSQDGAYRALATGGDQGYFFQNTNGVNTSMYVGLNGLYQGKVGIGNAAPGANLDVTGNIKITDGTQGAGKVLTSDSLGFASWQPAATSGWSLSGNSGINSTNFIGTQNNASLRIRTNNNQRMIVDSTGMVGIGTTTPLANLHITNPGSTSRILLGESNMSGGYTAFDISTSDNAGGYCNLQAIKSAGSAWGDIVLNRDGGSVAIGSTKVATGYKLSVNGSIMCTALRVQDFASWPDYVFANDYDLKSLSEVENYISANKRLPGMPSDCEVLENGIDVGQMQAKVVEKVEENTLYIIQLSKENQELKAQLKAMQAQLNAMQK